MSSTITRRLAVIATAGILTIGMSACGSSESAENKTASNPSGLSIDNAWAKAGETGKMAAAFGMLKNGSDKEITVLKVSSEYGPMELHTTTMVDGAMKMKEVESFAIPAQGSFELKPGGNHFMFMQLSKDLKAGEKVNIKVELKGGETFSFAAPVKPFKGANENYVGSDGKETDSAKHVGKTTSSAQH